MSVPATIKQGSTGAGVTQWQGILGHQTSIAIDIGEPDGIFGPKTKLATQEYQRQHKLLPDGIVGPATWSVALGVEPSATVSAQTPASSTDLFALDVARRAMPELSEAQRQYALTVARGEGFYGLGWKGDGKGSKNWGAVQGTGSAGFFTTTDHHADGKAYQGKFKRYKTDDEGFRDMATILFSGGKRGAEGAAAINGALKRGSLKDAVNAQHANGYFELDPTKYLAAVAKNYGTLSANLKWPQALTVEGKAVSMAGLLVTLAAGLATGIAGFLFWKSRS